MKKYLLYFAVLLFCCYWLINAYNAYKAINFQFKGRVQKVTQTSGYYKIITVNNKDYNLEWVRWYDDLYKIEVGDSVFKIKGTQEMTIVKK
jgi:hypothetical protein